MLEDIKKRLEEIYDEKTLPHMLVRIEGEFNIIGEDTLKDILIIKDILDTNYLGAYSFTGSVNSFYIAYLLGITTFNPSDYMIPYENHFTININIKERVKEKLVELIKEKIPYVKKVSHKSDDNNLSYSGFIFDPDDKLATYKTGIVKAKKSSLVHKYLIINIYEKMILTLLENMNYGNEYICCFFSNKCINDLKNKFNEKLVHKLPFEYATNDIDKVNLGKLINNNAFFDIKHIDEIKLEFNLCYFKYHFKRTYYINYLKYLIDKVDKTIINKYKDNYDKYLSENPDELTLEHTFYSLLADATKEIDNFKLIVNNNKVYLDYQNIHLLTMDTIYDKFDFMSNLVHKMNEEDEIDIFGFSGNDLYYLSHLIATDLGEKAFRVESYLNPMTGAKPAFDKEFYTNIDEEKYLKTIHFYRNNNIFLHTDFQSHDNVLDYIVSMCNSGTTKIIIDGLYVTKELYDALNKLNKEIYILLKIEG